MNLFDYPDQKEVEKLVAAQPEGTMFIMKPRNPYVHSPSDIAVKEGAGWRKHSRGSHALLGESAIVTAILIYQGTYIWSFS